MYFTIVCRMIKEMYMNVIADNISSLPLCVVCSFNYNLAGSKALMFLHHRKPFQLPNDLKEGILWRKLSVIMGYQFNISLWVQNKKYIISQFLLLKFCFSLVKNMCKVEKLKIKINKKCLNWKVLLKNWGDVVSLSKK